MSFTTGTDNIYRKASKILTHDYFYKIRQV